MKRISDKIKCKKGLNCYEIYIERYSIDQFGKGYTEYKLWDTYKNRELCEKASIDDVQSMVNCGYSVIDGYRNGIPV